MNTEEEDEESDGEEEAGERNLCSWQRSELLLCVLGLVVTPTVGLGVKASNTQIRWMKNHEASFFTTTVWNTILSVLWAFKNIWQQAAWAT